MGCDDLLTCSLSSRSSGRAPDGKASAVSAQPVGQVDEQHAIASAVAREAQEDAERARAELAEERRASQAAQAAASATTMWVRASASARVRAASGGNVGADNIA